MKSIVLSLLFLCFPVMAINLNWTTQNNTHHYEVWSTTNLTQAMTFRVNVGTNTTWSESSDDPVRFYEIKAFQNKSSTNESVTLTWQYDNLFIVQGFNLYSDDSGGISTNAQKANVGMVLQTTRTGFTSGRLMAFTVTATATNLIGILQESLPSNVVLWPVPYEASTNFSLVPLQISL